MSLYISILLVVSIELHQKKYFIGLRYVKSIQYTRYPIVYFK